MQAPPLLAVVCLALVGCSVGGPFEPTPAERPPAPPPLRECLVDEDCPAEAASCTCGGVCSSFDDFAPESATLGTFDGRALAPAAEWSTIGGGRALVVLQSEPLVVPCTTRVRPPSFWELRMTLVDGAAVVPGPGTYAVDGDGPRRVDVVLATRDACGAPIRDRPPDDGSVTIEGLGLGGAGVLGSFSFTFGDAVVQGSIATEERIDDAVLDACE